MPRPDYEVSIAEPKFPLADRPAETMAALALLPSAYGALTAISVPNPWAWIIAVVVALLPLVVSWLVDGFKEFTDPGDDDLEDGPVVAAGKHEKVGIDHHAFPG